MNGSSEPRREARQRLLRAIARSESGASRSASGAIPRRGLRVAPLSYAQSRLWFIDQLENGSAAYNVPAIYRLGGALDPGALQAAITEIVRRHEVLRTTFGETNGSPVQRIHDPEPISMPLIDLRALAPEERNCAAHQRIQELTGKPFDLAAGPLLRPALLQFTAEEHILLLTMHHIVSDGWSRGDCRPRVWRAL